ncbi:MAG: NIPSNAP family protein [Verrucomicrobiales bacterium]
MKSTVHSVVSALALAVASVSLTPDAGAQDSSKQLFELRIYNLKSKEKAEIFDRTVKDAYLPALKRAGVGPVGVFRKKDAGEGDPEIRYMVIPYDSADGILKLKKMLESDAEFASAAADYLSAGKGGEIVDRIESTLLLGFDGMPKLKLPSAAGDTPNRYFELRKYESLSEMKGILKVQMFNKAELAIFAKVGLDGVFFGQALVGADLPQLTYMLVYDDEAAKEAAWKGFLEHPDWLVLKEDQTYKDTVSKIVSTFLLAMDYSQVK